MNNSEQQLKNFLERNKNSKIKLNLKPQGDGKQILSNDTNLCIVEVEGKKYYFGGISEKVCNQLHKQYVLNTETDPYKWYLVNLKSGDRYLYRGSDPAQVDENCTAINITNIWKGGRLAYKNRIESIEEI